MQCLRAFSVAGPKALAEVDGLAEAGVVDCSLGGVLDDGPSGALGGAESVPPRRERPHVEHVQHRQRPIEHALTVPADRSGGRDERRLVSGRLRIVETPDGPVVQIEAGAAWRLAAAIGRAVAALPAFANPDRDLLAARALLLDVERRHLAGEGFAPETADEPPRLDDLTAAEAGRVLGVTPQAVTKRARLGQIPGARLIGGRWLIPRNVLPDTEENDDRRVA